MNKELSVYLKCTFFTDSHVVFDFIITRKDFSKDVFLVEGNVIMNENHSFKCSIYCKCKPILMISESEIRDFIETKVISTCEEYSDFILKNRKRP